jgi:hypothetical protein
VTNALNRAKSAKLALEILLVGAVVKTRHNQRLEGIAADVGIIMRVIYAG